MSDPPPQKSDQKNDTKPHPNKQSQTARTNRTKDQNNMIEKPNLQMSVMYVNGSSDIGYTTRPPLNTRGPPPPIYVPRTNPLTPFANPAIPVTNPLTKGKELISRLQNLRQGGNGRSDRNKSVGYISEDVPGIVSRNGGRRAGAPYGSESFILLGESAYIPALPTSPTSKSSFPHRSKGLHGNSQKQGENKTNPSKSTEPSSRKAIHQSGIFQRQLSPEETKQKQALLDKWQSKNERISLLNTQPIIQKPKAKENADEDDEDEELYSMSNNSDDSTDSLEELLRTEAQRKVDKEMEMIANEGLEGMWGMKSSLLLMGGHSAVVGDGDDIDFVEREKLSDGVNFGESSGLGSGGTREKKMSTAAPVVPSGSGNSGASTSSGRGRFRKGSVKDGYQGQIYPPEDGTPALQSNAKMEVLHEVLRVKNIENNSNVETNNLKDPSEKEGGFSAWTRNRLRSVSWANKLKEKADGSEGSESDEMPFAARK